MDWLFTAYCICLAVGIGYTIVAFTLGEITGGGHAGGTGDMHGDFSHNYGVSGQDGHGASSGTDHLGGHALLFGPFSPLVIAFFLTTLGGIGIILVKLTPVRFWSLPLSMVAALLFAWGLLVFLNKVLGGMQGSSDINLQSLVGAEAEVTVAIQGVGTGEVAYIAAGQRCLTPARSEDHIDIPRFATVRIVRILGNVFLVRAVEDAVIVPAERVTPGQE